MDQQPLFADDGACLIIEFAKAPAEPDRFTTTAAKLLKPNERDLEEKYNPWKLYCGAMDVVAAYSAVEIMAFNGRPIEVAKWSTPFLRVLIGRLERLDHAYRKLHIEDGRLLCLANGGQVVRYAGSVGLDYIGLTVSLIRNRLAKIRIAICPDTEGADECTAAWEPVTIEATYDRWPDVRATLANCQKIREHELKCEIFAELHRLAQLIEGDQSASLNAEAASAEAQLQNSASATRDVEILTDKDESGTTDSVKPTWRPRIPDKKAWVAHSLRSVEGITNQTEIAEEMTRRGMPIDQGTVSRKLKQVESYLVAGGTIPSPKELDGVDSVAPTVIDMGERQDGRAPRQRDRVDDESDE